MANIYETAAAAGTFTHFLEHATAAGVDATLKGESPLTVFAPTDEAVSKLSAETLAAVATNPSLLGDIVKYHVLEGKYTAVDLEGLSTATTLLGEDVEIHVEDDGGIKVDSGHLTLPGHEASNGVLYAVDTVLVPEAAALALQS